MTRLTLLVIAVATVTGCGQTEIPSGIPPKAVAVDCQKELATIRRTLARLHKVPEARLRDDVPMTRLGISIDILDFTELILELEDHYHISIPDAALVNAAGGEECGWEERFTLRSLAELVWRIRNSK